MPVYNAEQFLERSVRSVTEQTYGNIEILLIDDGSADGSLKACMKLADGDERIRVFHQEDLGSGAARNLGIENALGSYYYFADADDEVERGAVAKLVAEIETGRADLVVCGYSFVNRRRENLFTKSYERKLCKAEYIRKHYDDFIVRGKPYAMHGALWNKLYRAEIIKKNGLRVPTVRKSQDEIFNMMYLNCIDAVSFIPDVLYYYYIWPTAVKSKKYLDSFFDKIVFLKNSQLDIAYNWNRENRGVMEYICRVLAINIDVYIQMRYRGSRWFNFRERYEAVKAAMEVFARELPSREVTPDFRKYRYMLENSPVKLFLCEYLKEIELWFSDRRLK